MGLINRPREGSLGKSEENMAKITEFLKDVKIELGRVSWPTKKQTIQYTAIVILMSFIIAVFLASWDSIFSFILNRVLLK
jgi:preprotein translocase subunit SecE